MKSDGRRQMTTSLKTKDTYTIGIDIETRCIVTNITDCTLTVPHWYWISIDAVFLYKTIVKNKTGNT
jgi:hypothetical protein